MKKLTLLIILLAILLIVWFFYQNPKIIVPEFSATPPVGKTEVTDTQAVKVIAENLDVPWAIAFLPEGNLLVTERSGKVLLVDKNGEQSPKLIAEIPEVKEIGEGGLLGITLHPDFLENNYVYLYYTYSELGMNTLNRVVRMVYRNDKLADQEIIIDNIPGASNHNGGRIKFGPDKMLYIGTGDAENPSQAQNKNSLAGKILRVADDGKIVGNPFGNFVYSFGHRNVQGLAFNAEGELWATEHGRSGVLSGLDEVNLIKPSKNYGWPVIQGDAKKEGMETSVKNSGNTTWAPSGAAFVGNSFFFSGLRGEALYEVVIRNDQIVDFKEHLKNQYGRLREVILGPDNLLYITTSNRDGRGKPVSSDDRIIRINPNKL